MQPLPSSTQKALSDSIAAINQQNSQPHLPSIALLKFSICKTIIVLTLLLMSLIGIVIAAFMYYFMSIKSLKRIMCFNDLDQQDRLSQFAASATHVCIKDGGNETIQQIIRINNQLLFIHGNTRYLIVEGKAIHQKINYYQKVKEIITIIDQIKQRKRQSSTFYQQQLGLSDKQIQLNRNLYGDNTHPTKTISFWAFLIQFLFQPFFIMQYIATAVYIAEGVAVFGITLLIFSVIIVSVNYFLIRQTQIKFQAKAQTKCLMNVYRNNKRCQIYNTELVYGDIYIPFRRIECDSILVTGKLTLDQVNLTGESFVICKVAPNKLITQQQLEQSKYWLYEGTTVEINQQNQNINLAMAVHTGYNSKFGRMIYQISTSAWKRPHFIKTTLIFYCEVAIISIIIYFATLGKLLSINIDNTMIILRAFDFITFSFPAPVPILIHIAFIFSDWRLSKLEQNVYVTDHTQLMAAAFLKNMYYDKTGTITSKQITIKEVHLVCDGNLCKISNFINNIGMYPIAQYIFGACIVLVKLNQIDKKMKEVSKAVDQPSNDLEVQFQMKVGNKHVQVIKILQFSSEFKSMAVLARITQDQEYQNQEDQQTQPKYYVFIKGAAEQICTGCMNFKQQFIDFLTASQIQGCRTLGFAYRQVSLQQYNKFQSYFKANNQQNRKILLQNCNLLGFILFYNYIKDDVLPLIKTLKEAGIENRMITGDSTYTAIKIAIQSGIIPLSKKVILFKGKNPNRATRLKIHHKQIRIESQNIQFQTYNDQQFINTVFVIDNDYIQLMVSQHSCFFDQRIVVFSQITPQNKKLIIRTHKNIIETIFGNNSILGHIKDQIPKVGMIGDGINDMLAIKESDVGIAISESDACSTTIYVIKQIKQIQSIILQSKNLTKQVLQMSQYFGLYNFMSVIMTVILTWDVSYLTNTHLIYKTFATAIFITGFMTLSKPSKKLNQCIPFHNMMSVYNHLIFWGNLIIFTATFIGIFIYYTRSEDYQFNSKPVISYSQGWNGKTKICTVFFLISQFYFTFLPLVIYQSQPWKQSIWKNIFLISLIILNLMSIFIMSIIIITLNTNQQLSAMDLLPIASEKLGVIFMFMFAASFISSIYNYFVNQCCKFEFKLEGNDITINQ